MHEKFEETSAFYSQLIAKTWNLLIIFEVSDYSDTNVLGLFVIDSKKHGKKVLGLKFFKPE